MILRPPRRLLPMITVIGFVVTIALAGCEAARPTAANVSGSQVLVREVRPQDTDAAIDDWTEPHIVALDPAVERQGRLFVFFPGSFGRPANQRLLLTQAAQNGYHTIGLRYPNSWTVNSLCASTNDLACFGDVRAEILSGDDRSPFLTVSSANSIRNRLTKLLSYLARTYPDEGWEQFLDDTGEPVWNRISVGGHSQGGGHAALLGKQELLARVCMLSAPSDAIRQDGTFIVADWLSEPGVTPPGAYFGLASELEGGYERFLATWKDLGMAPDPVLADDTEAPYNNAQILRTRVEPAQPGAYHGSTAVDRNTPLLADGTPVLAPVWQYLCFPQTDAAATRIALPFITRKRPIIRRASDA